MSSILLSHKERAEGPWVKLQSEPSIILYFTFFYISTFLYIFLNF